VLEEHERALGKMMGEKRVKGVAQAFKSIITMPKFLKDDAKREDEESEEEEGEDEEMDEDEEEDDAEEDDAEEDDAEEEESDDDSVDAAPADLAWEDVFPADADGAAPAPEADSDGEPTPKKVKRMTTNKKKATNYYTTANVKNRNRDRKAPANPDQREKLDRKPGSKSGKHMRRTKH
jgi:nuclear GTP-binding protein